MSDTCMGDWNGKGDPLPGQRLKVRTAEGDLGCADVVAQHLNGFVVWRHSDMEYRRYHLDFLVPVLTPEQIAKKLAKKAMMKATFVSGRGPLLYGKDDALEMIYDAIHDGKIPGVILGSPHE